MTFKYKVIDKYERKIILLTNNFEVAQEIVLSQDEKNKHKKLLILREKM